MCFHCVCVNFFINDEAVFKATLKRMSFAYFIPNILYLELMFFFLLNILFNLILLFFIYLY